MKGFVLQVYELVAVLLPFVLVYFMLRKAAQDKPANPKLRFLLLLVFVAYIYEVFHLTGAGTLYNFMTYGGEIRADKINLVPFSNSIDVVGYFLNIFLFMPLGFLLPLLWPASRKARYVLLYGFSFSLLIEASQLLNNRHTDVDDLVMNSLGAMVGYIIFRLFVRITKWKPVNQAHPGYEPAIYIVAAFLGRFLLFNEIGLARLLYGF